MPAWQSFEDSASSARPCTAITPVMHGSYGKVGAPAESSKKQFLIFRLPCAWGRGGRNLPRFSGIIVMSPDMTCRYLWNYARGSLRRTEKRIIASSKTGGSGIL